MFASCTTDDVKLYIRIFDVIEPFYPSALLSQSTVLTHKIITLRMDSKFRLFLNIALATN